MKTVNLPRPSLSQRSALAAISLVFSTFSVIGCSSAFQQPSAPSIVTASGLAGTVFGGRQPISGATISLYQTGVSGYGSGASKVTPSVLSDSNGKFSFPAFTCTVGTQIYVVSSGGDPYGNGENNPAATLMAGLTSCSSIASVTKVAMNEVTTVATVWALAPFMNGSTIGATSTNQTGLANAFLDVATLVNTSTGLTPGANLPSGTTVPSNEINTLANALVACVNSVNTAVSTSATCSNLFSLTTSGSSVPTDTVSAALNIARNPGTNVSQIIGLGGTIQAFQPTITSANDLTIAISFTGNGLTAPTAIAADATGNIWITNTSSVTELTHTGSAVSGSPYTGSVNAPSAIAIDTSGNAWIANAGNSTLTELSPAGVSATGSPFSGGGLSSPASVAIDGLGNIWLANPAANSVSEFSSAGAPLSGTGFPATGLATPLAVAINPH